MTQTELLNTIRAEIERRKETLVNCNTHFFKGRLSAYEDILAFLDTLSEQEPEQPVKNPCSFYSEGYGCEISPMKNCIGCEHNRWGWGTKVAKKQPASEELEEEIKRYGKEEMPVVLVSDLNDIARHFAEWGAKHLKR